MAFQTQLLGRFTLRTAAGEEIAVAARKGQALIAILALSEGEPVARLDSASAAGIGTLEGLRAALQRLRPETEREGAAPAMLTIEGDRHIPFETLNSVMRICTRAGFGDIALSVTQLSRTGAR